MVVIFLLGFFLGRETSSNSPSPSIQTPLTKQPEASINKTDSVQTKTDVQCFVEALIISIYPNTALRLNNCKAAHVDVLENGFKKLAVKDNGKDVLKALEDYSRSNVELGNFDFFISMLIYQLSLENETIEGDRKNWILFPQNLLIPYESTYPEAYYYLALGYLQTYSSKNNCKIALEFHNEYRKLGGNIEIKFEDICKDFDQE
ncbi:MAG: hypothetical protein IK012_07435 [Fibrobacter sp.]|uniref:hypothetical protein n=1 Tax=Fibrobacter sp. TaxID=35828 RepID=UPI0025C0A95C|nr:hypothetical protein [Fibrobacter sp.]MBR4785068.1 hypothetical protein [Fibrobacter sp.]